MVDGIILFVFEVDKAFLKLLFGAKFALDEFGIGADDIFDLFFEFDSLFDVDFLLLVSLFVKVEET